MDTRKQLISLAIGAAIALPISAQAAVEVKWFGFGQLTAESLKQNDPDDSVEFDADRVRIGFKLKDEHVFGGLQVDFMQSSSARNSSPGNGRNVDFPAIIKDAFGGYKVNDAFSLKVGQFKTPVGMDFNESGKKLDITKRGMEKALVLERAAGVMASGRKIGGGFGYDIGFFNPAMRSSAVNFGERGDDMAFAVRGLFDMAAFHVELSYGESQTSTAGTSDYEVWDIAGSYKDGPITVKAEYIDGNNVRSTTNRDQTSWFIHGGYMFSPMIEGVLRFYDSEHELAGTKTDLQNTYVGVNIFLGSNKTNGRLQLNYVFTGGDDAGSAVPYAGVRPGYTDNAFLAQYQISF